MTVALAAGDVFLGDIRGKQRIHVFGVGRACSGVKSLNESGYRPFEGWLALVLMATSMRPTMRRTLFFCAFQDVELPADGIGAKGTAAAPAPSISRRFTEVPTAPVVCVEISVKEGTSSKTI